MLEKWPKHGDIMKRATCKACLASILCAHCQTMKKRDKYDAVMLNRWQTKSRALEMRRMQDMRLRRWSYNTRTKACWKQTEYTCSRILPATIATKSWRLLKTVNKYTLLFAFHAKAKAPQRQKSNAWDAALRRIETSLASHDIAPTNTLNVVVWTAIFRHARCAAPNRIFLKRRLTSVSSACFRHANAVHHDRRAQSIAAPTKI